MRDACRPLVTVLGASGFIGSAVTGALAARPVRLRLVARRPSVVPDGGAAEAEVLTADLTDPSELARTVAGADAVIHLVAHITGPATWRVADGDRLGERINLGVLLDLVDVLKARPHGGRPPIVIFAGSASQMCAPTAARLDGTEPDDPVTTYGRQKLAAERALKAATGDGVLRGVILRLPTVFGESLGSPGRDRGVVATMARHALAGQALTMWNDGGIERDLLYVDDAARAFAAALDHADALAGRHWLVGTGQRTRLADLFRAIADLVATATGQPPVPLVSVPPPREATVTDFQSYEIDSSAFRAATGWRPGANLADALAATVAAIAAAPHTIRTSGT
jgi:nucleoside-diphosphate-sugar epimerase